MLSELVLRSMGFSWMLSAMSYGDKQWRRSRRMLHTHLHSGVSAFYWPMQDQAAQRFVCSLLAAPQTPDTLHQLVHASFSQSIVKIVYGIDVMSVKSDYISVPEKVLEALNVAQTAGRFLVDSLPLRKSRLSYHCVAIV